MQNTFAFIIEQQAKFEDNFTRAESRYGMWTNASCGPRSALTGWRNWQSA